MHRHSSPSSQQWQSTGTDTANTQKVRITGTAQHITLLIGSLQAGCRHSHGKPQARAQPTHSTCPAQLRAVCYSQGAGKLDAGTATAKHKHGHGKAQAMARPTRRTCIAQSQHTHGPHSTLLTGILNAGWRHSHGVATVMR